MAIEAKGLAVWILLGVAAGAFAQPSGRVTARIVTPGMSAAGGVEMELVRAAGEKALAKQKSMADGTLVFAAVPPGDYELRIADHQVRRRNLRVFAAETTDLGTVTVGATTESSATAIEPQATAEVTALLAQDVLAKLPVLGRDPLRLVSTVAEAGINSRSPTFISGVRPGYTVVSLDGVNILDEFDRSGLDAAADRPLLGQVQEMAVITSNASAEYGFGYPQVAVVTPSGANQYHGELYWQNRNSYFGANNWFNNRDGVARPFLNRNSLGGSFGGPVVKDRLLAYLNYEHGITREQVRVNRTILTDDARQGIYTYQDSSRAIRKVNVLQTAGFPADPAIQKLLKATPPASAINNFLTGDSRADLLRNTAGYSYNLGSHADFDRLSGKLDYRLSGRNALSGTYYLQRASADQPGLSNDFAPRAKAANVTDADLFSVKWRWQPTASWTLETSAGRNTYSNEVDTSEAFGPFLLNLPLISNPVNSQVPYGRTGATTNISGVATYVAGRHLLQAGYQWQGARSEPFDRFNIIPTCTMGVGAGNPGLPIAGYPGLAAGELSTANAFLALLAGSVTNCFQSFNVQNRTSGFVPGAENRGNFSWGIHAAFVQDQWRLHPRLTLSLGLRYELPTVVDVSKSLLLLPVVVAGDPAAALSGNLGLDFSGSGSGRQTYRADRNNFAPHAGVAWRLDEAGWTILRAGYGISYVEDVSSPLILIGLVNEGLHRTVFTGRSTPVSTGPPVIPAPAFQVPVTLSSNFQSDSSQAVVLPDPRMRTPYIQQWTVGVEHRFRRVTVEGRYAGNHSVGLLRGIDENQVQLRESGFLDDFQRAANNGRLALQGTGVYNPNYNPAIAGSSPLTVFPRLVSGGVLTSATTQSLLITGQPAALAALYQLNRLSGPVALFPNPNAYQTWLLTNHDQSTYNALQENSGRMGAGIFWRRAIRFPKCSAIQRVPQPTGWRHFWIFTIRVWTRRALSSTSRMRSSSRASGTFPSARGIG